MITSTTGTEGAAVKRDTSVNKVLMFTLNKLTRFIHGVLTILVSLVLAGLGDAI